MDVNGDPGSTELISELQQVLAQRRLADFSTLELPHLATVAARATPSDADASSSVGPNAHIQSLLDRLIPTMPTKSEAAVVLIGTSDIRWSNQKERRHLAGKTEGVTGETFRKNYESQVLSELAHVLVHASQSESAPAPPRETGKRFAALVLFGTISILALAAFFVLGDSESPTNIDTTEAAPLDTSEAATPPTSPALPTTETTTTSSTAALVDYQPTGQLDVTLHCKDLYGAATVAEVAGSNPSDWECRKGDLREPVDLDLACASGYGPATSATNDGSGPYGWSCIAPIVSAPDGECAISPGEFDPESQYDLGRFAQTFAALGTTEPTLVDLCPAAVVHRAGEGVRQEFFDPADANRRPIAAVLSRSPDRDDFVTLSGAAWDMYLQVAGLGAGLVGYPLSAETEEADGSWRVPFSVGGGLVSANMDGPFQWMPALAYEQWSELGGLGSCLEEPVSNPYPVSEGFRQDFADGHLLLDFASGGMRAVGPGCEGLE